MVLKFGAQRPHLFNLIAVKSTLLCKPILNNVNLGGKGLWEDLQKWNEKSISVHISEISYSPYEFYEYIFSLTFRLEYKHKLTTQIFKFTVQEKEMFLPCTDYSIFSKTSKKTNEASAISSKRHFHLLTFTFGAVWYNDLGDVGIICKF